MAPEVKPWPRPVWSPLPQAGCHGVEGRVLLRRPNLMIAQLRFEPGGSIHEHAVGWSIDVFCLEGRGKTTVGGVEAAIEAGQRVRWPADKMHRLFTEDSPMLTLMVEHLAEAVRE